MLKINNQEEDQAVVTNKFMQEASKKKLKENKLLK